MSVTQFKVSGYIDSTKNIRRGLLNRIDLIIKDIHGYKHYIQVREAHFKTLEDYAEKQPCEFIIINEYEYDKSAGSHKNTLVLQNINSL